MATTVQRRIDASEWSGTEQLTDVLHYMVTPTTSPSSGTIRLIDMK